MIHKNMLFFLFYMSLINGAQNNSEITVVIPSAGIGTRMLPSTKVHPKELFPLLEKPIIHEIVDEGLRSGLVNFLFVIKKQKEAIVDYFDAAPELDLFLRKKNKQNQLSSIDAISQQAHFASVRQSEQLGLGHAILMAEPWITQKYFAVFLPDHIIFDEPDVTKKLINIIQSEKADAVIATEQIPDEEIPFRGIMIIKKKVSEHVYEISGMIEKPQANQAPSHFAVAGRYVFSTAIFKSIKSTEPDVGGEIGITEAINHMIQRGKRVLVYEIEGTSQDTGRPLPWLEANIKYALRQPEYTERVRSMLNHLIKNSLIICKKQARETGAGL